MKDLTIGQIIYYIFITYKNAEVEIDVTIQKSITGFDYKCENDVIKIWASII